MINIAILLTLVFFAIALLHFSWALGNQWGLVNTLPTDEEGELIFNPRKIDSASVGIGLLIFAVFYGRQAGFIDIDLKLLNWLSHYLIWLIPVIFLLRAIGEFRYVGFFKRVKETNFAYFDSKYYSPFCLLLSLLGFLVFYWS